MGDQGVRILGRVIGSLILVTGGIFLPAGAASAALMPDPAVTSLAQPPPGDQNRRLGNGEFIRAGSRTGQGELSIDNGGNHDGVVTLAVNKSPIYSVYVQQGSKYTVTGIRDGTYEVFFTTGVDWDSQNRNFTRDRSLQRFDDVFSFTTTSAAATSWSITIYPVPDGNANSSLVNPNDFPPV
ncbi:MAG: hypothetical protein ACRDS0_29145 [Pseudonocardiaceae bacterium]